MHITEKYAPRSPKPLKEETQFTIFLKPFVKQTIASENCDGKAPGPWEMKTSGIPATWQQGCRRGMGCLLASGGAAAAMAACGTAGWLGGGVGQTSYILEMLHWAIVRWWWRFASLGRGVVEKLSLHEALGRASQEELQWCSEAPAAVLTEER